MVLAVFALIAAISMVALGVDLGVVSLTKTKMQNAVDAAALAAAQEIITAVENVGKSSGDGADAADANTSAMSPARQMATNVAKMNGVHVDPEDDVRFGKRYYNKTSKTYGIIWDEAPYNVVKVTARRNNATPGKDDSELSLFFARIWGKSSTSLTASAVAYVEPRDIVLVLDYSASMNDDSELGAISKLGQSNVEANIYQIWQDLGSPIYGNMKFTPNWVTIPGDTVVGSIPIVTCTWKRTAVNLSATTALSSVTLRFLGGSPQTFSGLSGLTGSFQGTGSNSGKIISQCDVTLGVSTTVSSGGKKSKKAKTTITAIEENFDFYDDQTILEGLDLVNVPYPYKSGSWAEYIHYCRGSANASNGYKNDVYYAGHHHKFGMLTLIDYWNQTYPKFSQTHTLWKGHQYPVSAMRSGASLFTNFLSGLDFGDHVGLVTYDATARIETFLSDTTFPETVNLGNSPLTDQYADIATIVNHKQAGHYDLSTNIADGLNNAINLLEQHRRAGAKPIIILMTDGNANQKISNVSYPGQWNWNNLTDYNGDGHSDYSTNDPYKMCAMIKAREAVDLGFTIHTLTVGVGADRDFMKAIAYMGQGEWIDCPGGTSVGEMDSQLLAAFSKIAANVPPAKLMADPDQAD